MEHRLDTATSRFYISVPLSENINELRMRLMPGKYMAIVTTNWSFRQFSIIDKVPNYSAHVSVIVEAGKKNLASKTNANYMVFQVPNKNEMEDIRLLVDVQNKRASDPLILLLGRGF